jgi:hypothetical protein
VTARSVHDRRDVTSSGAPTMAWSVPGSIVGSVTSTLMCSSAAAARTGSGLIVADIGFPQEMGRGVLLRTEEMTSVKARTDAAAGSASSSMPVWVESTVRTAAVGGERYELVLGAGATVGLAIVLGAVSTARGRSSSMLRAGAWVKTSRMTDSSSRPFGQRGRVAGIVWVVDLSAPVPCQEIGHSLQGRSDGSRSRERRWVVLLGEAFERDHERNSLTRFEWAARRPPLSTLRASPPRRHS